jgi:bile acid-coenzyme A ligase
MITFQRAIFERAHEDPDFVAVECEGDVVTRRELVERATGLAAAYAELGVRPGDFVTVALPNGVDFHAAFVASWLVGATPQPVSSTMPTREREAVVEAARSVLVVHGGDGAVEGTQNLAVGEVKPVATSPSADQLDRFVPSWKAPTSGGSTGRPKVIVDTTPNLIDLELPDYWRWGTNRAHVVPCPLYHNAPLYHSMHGLARGNTQVLTRRFDAEKVLGLIQTHRAHWVVLVPTMMQRIMRLPDETRLSYDVSTLEFLLHTAAVCPPWLKQAWIDWIGAENICELYGSTEGTSTTCIWGDEWLAHRGSVGKPIVGELKVTDEAGNVLPAGEIGEIWMRSETPTFHYRGAEPKERDGWQSMGDLGWLDPDDFLFIADRRLDMIITGGHNVFPAEVEAALDEHPEVEGSVVVGVPDSDMGESVHAIVETHAELQPADLHEFLATRLTAWKRPRTYEFTRERIRNEAGKVRRSQVRDDATARIASLGG